MKTNLERESRNNITIIIACWVGKVVGVVLIAILLFACSEADPAPAIDCAQLERNMLAKEEVLRAVVRRHPGQNATQEVLEKYYAEQKSAKDAYIAAQLEVTKNCK